jgi:hypothetical protein
MNAVTSSALALPEDGGDDGGTGVGFDGISGFDGIGAGTISGVGALAGVTALVCSPAGPCQRSIMTPALKPRRNSAAPPTQIGQRRRRGIGAK